MQRELADRSYVSDMLTAARQAERYVLGMSLAEYILDDRTQAAVERRIEIIGEAARLISDDFKNAHAKVPWQKIVSQRHLLAPEYGDIDHHLIWRVVVEHLPQLIQQLDFFLANESTPVPRNEYISPSILLCPGQGAQALGMGRKWAEASKAARATFDEADRALGNSLGAPLSEICFNGPFERLNQTDVSQPAIYVCSAACYRGMVEKHGPMSIAATAGLSLGEYTALHLAGVFDFIQGLNLVATRGRLMQESAVASKGGMMALIGADDAQAQAVCDTAAQGQVLVCANFNAPGQVVLSGQVDACQRALQVASDMGLKATPLTVAGAFHSALMQPAADQMAKALAEATFQRPNTEVWSNVTAQPHDPADLELLKRRLVEQIVSPVRWSQSCMGLASSGRIGQDVSWHELAPGSVLRGLMRRIDRNVKVTSHDEPPPPPPDDSKA